MDSPNRDTQAPRRGASHTPRTPRGGASRGNNDRRHAPRTPEGSARGGGYRGSTPRGAPRGGRRGEPASPGDNGHGANSRERGGRAPRVPKPALAKAEIDEGIKAGRLYKGLLRVNPSTRKSEAYVIVAGFARDVLVTGQAARGRAFDGDTVAVELLEYSRWQIVMPANAPASPAGKTSLPHLNDADSDVDDVDDVDANFDQDDLPAPLVPSSPASASVPLSAIASATHAASTTPLASALDAADEDNDDGDDHDEALRVTSSSPVALSAPSISPLEGEIRRPTGRVVAIIEEGHQEMFAGSVKPCGRREKKEPHGHNSKSSKEENSGVVYTDRMAFFVPLERRCPKLLIRLPVMTPHSKILQEFNNSNNLFVARLQEWKATQSFPYASLLSLLGDANLPKVQQEALNVTHDLPLDEFPPDALAAIPPEASRDVQPNDLIGRRDLRSECVFTIDPATARDLDDALHVKLVNSDPVRYEVGIHIADVAHFLRPNTPLDREARRRATSVYLVQKVIPMLPRLLCEHACSLNPAADRLAFSVVCTLDAEGRVQGEPWFGRTVIHSVAKLSYDTAQLLLDGASPMGVTIAPTSRHDIETVRNCIRILHSLSLPMRRRRFEAGALALGSSKLVFTLDKEGAPIAVGTYPMKETNRLIEEFMLLANVCVARRIAQAFSDGALLRRHASPPENKLADLSAACAKLNAPLAVSNAGSLNASLEALRAGNAELHMLIQHMCTKPMQTAKYIATDSTLPTNSYTHYALSFSQYTHFTSPIRRYADVAVHRLLAAALAHEPSPFRKDEIEMVAANCNKRKMNADKASDDCDYLYLCRYLQTQNPPLVDEAVVLELSPAKNWIVMLLVRFDMEEMLFLRDLQATETWNAAQDQLTLSWPDSPSVTLRALSRVSVRLLVNTEIKPLAIRLHLVRPTASAAP